MDALADAADLPREDVRTANIFPELFNCAGFALTGRATRGGELFHGRVLDYKLARKIDLAEHAVIFICVPDGRTPFVSVGFAGFIGCITATNAKRITLGVLSQGGGAGQWEGVPMAFLVRRVLEEAGSLDDAHEVILGSPRTCEYFYVISDANNRRAAVTRCTGDEFETIGLGESHPHQPKPIADTVMIALPKARRALGKRVRAHYGGIGPGIARDLMARPVAGESNMHCVLFAPERLALWVAVREAPEMTKRPQACYQPYVHIDIAAWLERAADLASGKNPVQE